MTGRDEVLSIWEAAKTRAALAAPLRCYSLSRASGSCDVKCAARVAEWADKFRVYAARRPNEGFDVLPRSLRLSSGDIEVNVFEQPLGMLEVPRDIAEYDHQIGDKSRNMTRKALRAGYCFKAGAQGSDHLQDIFDIRNSSPTRLGVAIPEYWKRPASAPTNTRGLCDWHGELFYGVFLGNAMVAYATLYLFGEIAQFNQSLGHANHLSNGVMNLLVRGVVEQLQLTHPQVRAINYLYPDAKYALGRFKRGIGVVPLRTLTTLAPAEAARAVEELLAPAADQVEAQKSRAKPDGIDITLELAAPEVEAAVGDDARDGPLRQLLGRLALEPNARVAFSGFPEAELSECSEAIRSAGGSPCTLHDELGDRVAAIFVAPGPGLLSQALGKRLQAYASALNERGFLAIRLPHRPALAHACGALSADEAGVVQGFLERRFRSATPSSEDYLRGFKGGDFQLRGLFELGEPAKQGFAWLLLRKVSNR